MDSAQMDAFLLSAEYLSFSEAAKVLYTTQPSVSRRIRALEEEVGEELFVRKQNQIALTRAGQILYDEFVQLKFSLEGAIERARGKEDIVVAKLRIGCINIYDYGVCLPPEVLQRFEEECPGVQLSLHFGSFRNIRTMLLQNEIDIAITFGWDLEAVPGISVTKLYASKPCFILSKRNPHASKIEAGDFKIEELRSERFYAISSVESPGRAAEIQNCCLQYGFVPNDIVYCQNNRSMMEYIYQGYGVTIVDMNSPEVHRPEFLTIPISNYRSVELVAVCQESAQSPLSDVFLEIISDHFAQKTGS